MSLGKCSNCDYLKDIIRSMQEDNKHLLNQLLMKNDIAPVLSIEQRERIDAVSKIEIEHDRQVDAGEVLDYGSAD